VPLDPTTLRYANLLIQGTEFPPIKVQDLGDGCFKIKDGRHRWAAHKLAGLKEIDIKFGKVTDVTYYQKIERSGCGEYVLGRKRRTRVTSR